ncbi:hypothetical protein [Corynebacterium sp. A21]|uniref:hypothetical protein n=1 Tax=Corynebacterium sp. A21 TaxID=3457318 RepID=UPI003FD2736A
MDAYSNMRSHVTPIPTPPAVRFGASALIGIGVAMLSTDLSRGSQIAAMVIAIGAAFLLTFSHPYRRELRAYLEKRNVTYRPKFGQVIPLFLVWLALMLVPAVAPLPIWGTLLVGLGIFAWMLWVFPHVDGSRALAFV